MLFSAKKNKVNTGAAAIPSSEPASSPQTTPQPGVIVRPGVPSTPSVITRPGAPSTPSVIGRELMILGNLVSIKGEVLVEGQVQGDVHGRTIWVGEHGRIIGGIISDEVVVRGQVTGSIHGKRVVLSSTGHVEGDIYHQSLAIEPGAYFKGMSRRTEDPTAGVPRPDIADMESSGAPAQPDAAITGIPIPPRIDV